MTIDGSWWHYVKWHKSDRKRQILCDLTYMWNLKQKQNKQTKNPKSHRLDMCVPAAECEGRGSWKKVVKRYKLLVTSTRYVEYNMMAVPNSAIWSAGKLTE